MISQNSKIHKNTFQSGVNKDFNKTLVPSESMVDAHNVALIDNGVFYSVQNIKGTTSVEDILSSASNARVIGVYPSNYTVLGVPDIPCLTIFLANDTTFYIYCYDTENDDKYLLFQDTIESDYVTDDRVIDVRKLAESGVDILYFLDNYHEPRKLRCEIPDPYSPNFLTAFDLSLLRRGAIGTIDLDSVSTGGSLFTGTYQFAYQMLTPSKNKFTRWSLLTNPIHVYNNSDKAGVGLSSDKKITLDITPSEDELDNFTHFRLAVLENIYPEGASNTACSLTDILDVTDYLSGSSLVGIEYKASLQNNLVDLAEVVVDHAAIKTAKTLEIRDNRLLLGNIVYKNLEYDNNTPSIGGGSILSNSFTPYDEEDSSTLVGHYRGEVYRYAISYFDSDGNYSSPVALDLSSVTNNQSSQTGFKDMKFPKRDQVLSGTRYSLLSGNNPINLGLQLTGIDNHPTWAKGFVILRRKRIKDIQWQSPLIPMMPVYGIGAIQDYPTIAQEDSGKQSYPDAVPMGPNNTFVPMNLFWAKMMRIHNNTTAAGSGVSRRLVGEAQLSTYTKQSMSIVFPPQTMYSLNDKYTFNQSHQLETIDACKVNQIRERFSTESSSIIGGTIESSLSGTFYALRDDLYYYDDSHSGAKPALRSANFNINGYKDFDNFSEGTSINGRDVMLYDNLVTDSVSFNGIKPPNIQRCGVVDLADFTPINLSSGLTFAAGGTTVTPASTSGYYTSSGFGTSATESPTGYINTVEIVNCVAGLNDDRYGPTEAPQEYIWTGTKVVFTNAELSTVEAAGTLPKTVDVWGGDCVVSSHTFKITDSSYNLINQVKYNLGAGETFTTAFTKWGKCFAGTISTPRPVITMPVNIKNNATYIQIYLESEYNGDVTDYNNLDLATGSTYLTNSIRGVNYVSKENICRVPLSYSYNSNLVKKNDDKIFSSVDQNIPVITNLRSRILYSDVKVYQTQIEGFDIFRVLNFHDLLETYGKITKLQLVGDNLYSLQDSAVSHIGIGERVIEATDASQLSVRSNEFIGTVQLLSTIRGCQHLKSVVSDGNIMYFADNFNKSINAVGGLEVQVISDTGLGTEFRTQFNSIIPERELIGLYDPIKKEYLIGKIDGTFCWVYNTALNLWVSNYEFPTNSFLGSAYINQKLYNIGQVSGTTQISVNEMYTGNNTQLMGTYVVPRIKIVANPDLELAKTFDDILLVSSDRLDTLDVLIERESALGNQTINGIDLDVSSRGEGNFRAKILRDSENRRPRGLYGIYTIKWNSSVSSTQVNLTSVLTKYRTSENIF